MKNSHEAYRNKEVNSYNVTWMFKQFWCGVFCSLKTVICTDNVFCWFLLDRSAEHCSILHRLDHCSSLVSPDFSGHSNPLPSTLHLHVLVASILVVVTDIIIFCALVLDRFIKFNDVSIGIFHEASCHVEREDAMVACIMLQIPWKTQA